jgi:hypothetical protein
LVPLEMSTIDIEAPGADEAALKAAIQALVPISTTAISSPVNYVDITLPSGYSAFRLTVAGLVAPDAVRLIGAFSQDGGATWLEDFAGDADNYSRTYFQRPSTAAFGSGAQASLGVLDLSVDTIFINSSYTADILINPGSASEKALAIADYSNSLYEATYSPYIGRVVSLCLVNTQRVNALRVIPDNSVTGPGTPDVLYTMTAGSLSLYGVL